MVAACNHVPPSRNSTGHRGAMDRYSDARKLFVVKFGFYAVSLCGPAAVHPRNEDDEF